METSIDHAKSLATGRRSFELKHIQTLIKLDQALELDQPLESLSHSNPEINSETREIIKKEILKIEKSIRSTKEKLESIESKRSMMRRAFHACFTSLEGKELTEKEKKWFTLNKTHLKDKLSDLTYEDLRLRAKLSGLEAELHEFQLNDHL
ncbi:hypothetical protein [Reichenbachiella versicolor]|uniref:hypothetical protein n=1 Tax=Reichenbachiella versicolor TaxID=1821036 RepID=UPI0013A57718|nr:hypothetical protein [Reichenbachiella versicolor]